ncbi:GNAT family N-acyltransferase [Sediminimonas sp.]|uniref:GNAT family N-acetyltransferase n=1 Tax=Sediminimonas sp. TaxID=2823379 RepID=UPI0025FC2187|nr:GNAT family N-acyltransferase [Sediminimonas sp.]
MSREVPQFEVGLARSETELHAAQRLRYEVFVAELGGGGPMVDHDARLERDRFDPFFEHLILRDLTRPEGAQVVGVYRLLDEAGATRAGQFYSEDEYNLAPLRRSGRRLLELGRSCLHRDYRGGGAMHVMWSALADHISARGIEILFGVASFHGTDVQALAQPLSLLHHRHLAPPGLRVRARPPGAAAMDLIPEGQLDRRAAMLTVPALIKAYLRLGGCVGDGAFVDRDFNTTDVCLVLDMARVDPARRAFYQRGSDKRSAG